MYDFVDRPLARLAPGGRFLIFAARSWIRAASAGICPPGAIGPAFSRHGVLPALPPFHTLLADLNRRARNTMGFAPIGYGRVAEDEAILLQLCRDSIAAPARARTTLALLLTDGEVGQSFTSLLALTARLDEGGLGEIAVLASASGGV